MQISKRNFMKSTLVGLVGLFLGINPLKDKDIAVSQMIKDEKEKIKLLQKKTDAFSKTMADYRVGETIEWQYLKYN